MRRTSFPMLLSVLAALAAVTPTRTLQGAPPVRVDSADPPETEQGVTNLDVTITGSGFSQGNQFSEFFVTGTTNPGGVAVNGTTFLDSKHVKANITVSDTAVVGYFDIQVTSNGRTGKGIEKFSVKPKGGNVCSLRPLPSQFTQIATFTGTKRSAEFGSSIAAAPVETANPMGTQAVAVTYTYTSTIDIFLLDPMFPENMDGAAPHLILTVPDASEGYGVIEADVDGNGVSDVIAFDRNVGVFIFLGELDAGVLAYPTPVIQLHDASPRFGASVAVGNLDSDPAVEIAVGAPGETSGRYAGAGRVVVFDWGSTSGPVYISSPTGERGDRFGTTLAIGDVTGDGNADLAVGAPGADVSGIRDAGATYVFPHGELDHPPEAPLTGDYAGEGLRLATLVETGDADSAVEVFSDTSVGSSSPRGVVFHVTQSGQDVVLSLPIDGLDTNYNQAAAGDFDLDGTTDLLVVGAMNATESSNCPNIGAVHAYLQFTSGTMDYVLQPPDSAAGDNFYGAAIAALTGTNLLLVSERRRELDGDSGKDGLVYVYRVTP
jgi:FG-GAP repeat